MLTNPYLFTEDVYVSHVAESVMLKQSPSRNQRSKGFKVKHALHICLLLAICIWLLYQVKQTYGKRSAMGETSREMEKSGNGHGILKLGRKGLDPQMEEIAAEFKKHEDEEGELEQEDEEEKLRENEGEQGGVGDDEIDGHDQEKAEDEEEETDQLEDLIDEGDKEKEEAGEGKGNVEVDSFGENVGSISNQHRSGVRRNSEEGREEHYRGDIDSKHNTQLISEKETGILRAVKEEEQVMNAAKNEDKNRT